MTQMSRMEDAIEDASPGQGRDGQTFAVIGAAMTAHSTLGHGFLEPVYQEALAIELRKRGVPFEREVELPIYYEGERLACGYRADFICYGDIVVELKALGRLAGVEQAQVLNYLKATGFVRGLLLNFGAPRLDYKRIILSRIRSSETSATSADRISP